MTHDGTTTHTSVKSLCSLTLLYLHSIAASYSGIYTINSIHINWESAWRMLYTEPDVRLAHYITQLSKKTS